MPHATFILFASDRPLINVDGTLVVNIVLWIVLFMILKGLLFEPMIRLFAAREKGMEGSREDARHLEGEARTRRNEYESRHRSARGDAAAERDRLRAEGMKTEGQILAESREAINTRLESQRAELRKQREALQNEIRSTVPVLAADIATKVLGREVHS